MKILDKIATALDGFARSNPWDTPEARTRALKRLGPPRASTLHTA
jgi:hypothetical protein